MRLPFHLFSNTLFALEPTHVPVMTLFNPAQQSIVDHQKRQSAHGHDSAFHDCSNLCRNTPVPMLIRIHTRQRSDQSGEPVQGPGQVQSVQQPDVVLAPANRQPDHTHGADTTADGSDNEQGDILDLRIVAQVSDAGKGSWEDDEASQHYPREERGEDVVQARNGVQVQEHFHVACSDSVLSLDPWAMGGR